MQDINSAEVYYPGYVVYRQDRRDTHNVIGGGVLLYCNVDSLCIVYLAGGFSCTQFGAYINVLYFSSIQRKSKNKFHYSSTAVSVTKPITGFCFLSLKARLMR